MRNRTALLATLMVCLVCSSSASAGETPASVEKKILDAWEDLHSMTAKMNLEMTYYSRKIHTSGSVDYWKAGGKNLLRMEMHMTQSAGGPELKTSTTSVSDDEKTVAIRESPDGTIVTKERPTSRLGSPGGRMMFDDLKEKNKLAVLPDEKLEGMDVFVIEATLKDSTNQPYEKAKIYFAKKTGMLVKLSGINGIDQEILTLTYSDIKINPKIDPDRFVLIPPADAQIIDNTGSASP